MDSDKSGRRIRHITSINDLSNSEIEQVFSLAGKYLKTLGDNSNRIERSTEVARGRVLACLFLEPSTRTRLSFECAMLRLGGSTITSTDPSASSAAKGESLADAVRVVSGYCDAIVLRHPRDGAAKLAAQFATVPVINGGDGAHEHPTQTLADLYTLLRECGKIKGLSVAIAGDLKHGRTVHSLCYGLARFGAKIIALPAPGLELPQHVIDRSRNEFGCEPVVQSDVPVDALYVTRLQKERVSGAVRDYMKFNRGILSQPNFSKAVVLHPLPRVDELDPDFDDDSRAAYFRQAWLAVPVRMALLSLLLNCENKMLGQSPETTATQQRTDISCRNSNCIVHDPAEKRFAVPKFLALQRPVAQLRCFYCETDLE